MVTLDRARMIARILISGALLSTVAGSAAAQPATRAHAESQLFAMQSNFWVNLHHFLYVTARARRGLDAGRPAVTSALGDTTGFGALAASLRQEWEQALEYYAVALADRDVLFDSVLVHRAASRAQGKRMLRSPTHPFVFYTAGEVTRRLFPGHVPYAESVGLWARARDLGLMLPLLRRHWQPWLDGTISLDEALRRIVTDL